MMARVVGRFEDPTVARRSLATLYERHADDAVGLAYLLTGDRALAEDLMQEAFVRIAARFGHIRDPAAFGTYLRRSVINLANSHFRRRALERQHLQGDLRSEDSVEPDLEVGLTLRDAIFRLPIRQRTALVLRFYEDLPEREIAELLRCRTGAVKQLVFRAMQSLRRDLAEEEGGES
jgi:RNA polymerase sigma factor (sigma-70 family)